MKYYEAHIISHVGIIESNLSLAPSNEKSICFTGYKPPVQTREQIDHIISLVPCPVIEFLTI